MVVGKMASCGLKVLSIDDAPDFVGDSISLLNAPSDKLFIASVYPGCNYITLCISHEHTSWEGRSKQLYYHNEISMTHTVINLVPKSRLPFSVFQ